MLCTGTACVLWAHRSLLLSNPDSFYQQSRIALNLSIAVVTSQSNTHLVPHQRHGTAKEVGIGTV